MPYSLRQASDGGWDIIKAKTGEKVGHSEDRAQAQASVRARYAAESDSTLREAFAALPASAQRRLREGRVQLPPNLRMATGPEHCGNCKMFDNNACWGYGNWPVRENMVCDSWAAEGG